MKKFLFMLLASSGLYAQQEVFNVQQYCVDQKPFKKGECDVSGNEYSFVFLNNQKKEVVFFFTFSKLKYKILESHVEALNPNSISYILEGDNGAIEMKINKQKTKMEFLYPDNHIYLTVGKSTKAGL